MIRRLSLHSTSILVSIPIGPALPFQGWFQATKGQDQVPIVSPTKPRVAQMDLVFLFLVCVCTVPQGFSILAAGYQSNLENFKNISSAHMFLREILNSLSRLGLWWNIHRIYRFSVYVSVELSTFTLCNHHQQNFSSLQTETLSPLNNNSPFLLPSAPGNHQSTSCLPTQGASPEWGQAILALGHQYF